MIEAARMEDGTLPADVYLLDLEESKPHLLADVAVRFEDFARYGELSVPVQLNHLEDEIWEIKTPIVRLPFYRKEDHPKIPAVRITGGFEKRGQRTPPKYIRRAKRVRAEDV